MGIYDREYYRGESRGPNLFATAPVCKAIIILNVAIFVFDKMLLPRGSDLSDWFAATSQGIFHQGHIWELVTATFLHQTLLHLACNMLFFWIVGSEIEAMYGQRDFLALYLSAGIISTLVWAATDSFSLHPGRMIGASGAVWTIVVLYALFYPRRELLFMFVIPVEMWLLVVLFLAYDVYQLLYPSPGMSIAVESHLAGAAYGYLFKRFDLRWSRLPMLRKRKPKFRLINPEPREKPQTTRPSTIKPNWATNSASISKPSTTAVLPEEQLDAKLDEILAKIARDGRGSLNEEENRILQEASRRAQDRRSDRL